MAAQTAYISDGKRVVVLRPPLLTPEKWKLIHTGRDFRRVGGARLSKYPLTGHLRCEHGAPINVATGVVWTNHQITGRFRTCHIAGHDKIRYECTCTMRRADELEVQARALLAHALSDPSDPLALRTLTAPPDPTPDSKPRSVRSPRTP